MCWSTAGRCAAGWMISSLVLGLLLLGPTSAAQARPLAGHTQRFTFGSGAAAHPYIVYTPSGYRSGQRLALVVMVHGCQTTAYQQMKANLYNPLADREHFVVVYPDVDAAEAAQPDPLRDCWQFFSSVDWMRGQGDGAVVAGITRAVITGWNIDRQRVYLMGMSAGSYLTADMAAEYPDLYAAVGENAGSAYADPSCILSNTVGIPVTSSAQQAYAEMGPRARIVPKLMIGGDEDTAVSPACADASVQQSLRTDNLVISHSQTRPISLRPASVSRRRVLGGLRYTVSRYDDQHGCMIGERYLVHGMNHFWSGGSANPRWASFTDPRGPSAAVASWDFFSHFTLSNTSQPCAHASAEHR